MTRITKDEAVMNSNYGSYLTTGLSPFTSFNVFAFSIREIRGQPSAAATPH
jgi:hypothetical protein